MADDVPPGERPGTDALVLAPFDVIRLPAGLHAEGVDVGAVGTILEIHALPSLAYEVEVADGRGRTIWIGAVDARQVELVQRHHPRVAEEDP